MFEGRFMILFLSFWIQIEFHGMKILFRGLFSGECQCGVNQTSATADVTTEFIEKLGSTKMTSKREMERETSS